MMASTQPVPASPMRIPCSHPVFAPGREFASMNSPSGLPNWVQTSRRLPPSRSQDRDRRRPSRPRRAHAPPGTPAGRRRIPPYLRTVRGNSCIAMGAGEHVDGCRGCGRRGILSGPCYRSWHDLGVAASLEPDQCGSDVTPIPAGQIDAEYGGRLPHHAAWNSRVATGSMMIGRSVVALARGLTVSRWFDIPVSR